MQREQQRADDREQRHRLGEAVDRRAPLLLEQQQDRGDQRAGVADTDPPDEVDDAERPADRDVVPPDADALVQRPGDGDHQHAEQRQRDGEAGPPALARAAPDVRQQAVVDGLVGVQALDERLWLERIARVELRGGHYSCSPFGRAPPSRGQLGVGVAHARQVDRARAGADLVQQIVATRVGVKLRHLGVRVVQRTEHDRARRAALLAGGLQLTVEDDPPLDAGGDALALDALHAVRALLHDAARADGDVRVHPHLARGRVVRDVVEVVEAPHLVGAVVAAVAGADAAVVDHLVQALVAVDGGVDRADVFAGRRLAVHTRERLHDHLGILERSRVVAVDADPVHLAALVDVLLADGGDVVLRLAGDDAGAAAGALVEVDRHRPLVVLAAVVDRLVDLGLRVLGVRAALLDLLVELRLRVQHLGDRRLDDGRRNLAAVGRHLPVVLGDREGEAPAGLLQLHAAVVPGGVAGAQRARVEADAVRDRLGAGAAVAERQRDRVVGVSRHDQDRRIDPPVAVADLDDVAVFQTQRLGGRLGDHGRVVPGQLRDRVRQLLQPDVVREPAVVQLRIDDEGDLHALLAVRAAAA